MVTNGPDFPRGFAGFGDGRKVAQHLMRLVVGEIWSNLWFRPPWKGCQIHFVIDSFLQRTVEFKKVFWFIQKWPISGDPQYSPFLFSPYFLWCPKLGRPSRFYGALARNRNALGSAWFSCSLIVGAGCISCGLCAPPEVMFDKEKLPINWFTARLSRLPAVASV